MYIYEQYSVFFCFLFNIFIFLYIQRIVTYRKIYNYITIFCPRFHTKKSLKGFLILVFDDMKKNIRFKIKKNIININI
jgi:hypothetical protein